MIDKSIESKPSLSICILDIYIRRSVFAVEQNAFAVHCTHHNDIRINGELTQNTVQMCVTFLGKNFLFWPINSPPLLSVDKALLYLVGRCNQIRYTKKAVLLLVSITLSFKYPLGGQLSRILFVLITLCMYTR